MNDQSFDRDFEVLTGHAPFPWQRRLYEEWFKHGYVPTTCDLPTGLGKTSVIAVWLIALARGASLPRRLVYVVNRRTVVDQTTNEAIKLRDNAAKIGIDNLAISTLRGQFADNHEWSEDPSRPAVICGTVDMIGSRLLFSGYRTGFKSRPLHAGLLGQDALLVHDEAHLEPAFQKLIETIEYEQRCRERTGELPWPKLRLMQLTATTRNGQENGRTERACGLTPEEQDLPHELPNPATEPIHHVWQRIKARKALVFHQAADGKDAVADEIVRCAKAYKDSDAAVLIYVRTLDDVKTVCDKLTDKKDGVVSDCVQQLTGTMRGFERDRMTNPHEPNASRVFARFLKPPKPGPPESKRWKTEPMPGTVYLVCTSAGEVGIDISADHMVCDLSTFESMVQRFGRVNRFGDGDARIDVVYPTFFGKIDKKTGELKAHAIDKRRQNTLDLLRKLPKTEPRGQTPNPVYDASPKGLCELRDQTDLPCRIDDAYAPEPRILPVTDILFDAWALTSIREKVPGRPEVGRYLHGFADDESQTTVAWRAELDLLAKEPSPFNRAVDVRGALIAVFAKHRIRPHETVTTTSRRVVDFLDGIVKKRPDLRETRVGLIFGRDLRTPTLGEIADDPGPLYAEPTLVLPATLQCVDSRGILSIEALLREADDASLPASLDVADHDGYEPTHGVPTRLRLLIERTEDGWKPLPLPGGRSLPDSIDLEPKRSTDLIRSLDQKTSLRVRLVQPIELDEEGDPIRALVVLSAPTVRQQRQHQSLVDHVGEVEQAARRIVENLTLPDPFRSALLFAARWHDEGKKAPIWQHYIGGPNTDGTPLGKSAVWRDPKKLAGYRHEFGSLLRIPDDETTHFFTDPQLRLSAEQQEQARDLALHLIAAHHGHSRPHFRHTFDRDFTTQQSDHTHIESIRRFARLQHRHGRWGLAYLHSLLCAADVAASHALGIDPAVDDDIDDAEGDEA